MKNLKLGVTVAMLLLLIGGLGIGLEVSAQNNRQTANDEDYEIACSKSSPISVVSAWYHPSLRIKLRKCLEFISFQQ